MSDERKSETADIPDEMTPEQLEAFSRAQIEMEAWRGRRLGVLDGIPFETLRQAIRELGEDREIIGNE